MLKNTNKEYYDNIKNNLTIEDIYKILDFYKSNPIIKNNIIIAKTICHGGDSHKLYYYNNTKLFKCYTGCGEDFFDIYELIIKITKNSFNQEISLHDSLQQINNIIGSNFKIKNNFIFKKNEENLIEKQKEYLNLINEKKEKFKYSYYDENILNFLDRVIVKEWVNEGISIQTQYKYGIRFYPITGQIVIPHYDISNKLIGIRGRYLTERDCELYGKYKPLYILNQWYSHPLSFSLYGINFNHVAISKAKKAIIFESEKSVMIFDSFFGEENNISVACCGSNISKQQIELLLSLGVNEIILALDRQYKELDDEENIKYVKNIIKIAEKIINFCNVSVIYDKNFILSYKDSPIDKGKNTFLQLFNSRIFITDKIIEQYKKEFK